MTRLSIILFGAPRIELDGSAVELDTRKAIAMLAYLVLTGGRHTRDAMATLLWPEYDQSRSRAALRRTLSVLKSAVSGYGLGISREDLGLDPSADIWVDIVEFRARLSECDSHGHTPAEVCPKCLSPLKKAAALFQGDFMAGFTLRDSPEFDEWQYFQGDRLRREGSRALKGLAQCYAEQGQLVAAIRTANRLLELDPLQESAHRLLMELYALNGQRTDALRQYRECVRNLEEELGVPPLEETKELYERILSGEFTASVAQRVRAPTQPIQEPTAAIASDREHSPTTRTVMPSRMPLVGRSAEWSILLEAYDSIRDSGRLVAITGEAGIGKSRLAQAFLEAARKEGAATIAAQSYQGESRLAFSSILEGLRDAISERADTAWWQELQPQWLAEASRLVPELARLKPHLPQAGALDSIVAQGHFFEGVSQVIAALCRSDGNENGRGDKPGILFLDDLHWADEATLDLLTYFVRRLRGRPILLLVTWRDELLPSSHRLRQLMVESQRAGSGSVLSLERLTEPAVRELVEATLGADGEALVSRLYRESEGLPFFLVEYLTGLDTTTASEGPALEASDLEQARYTASENGWAMPASVRALLRTRLGGVSETGWQLLNTAAVIGRSFDFDTARGASGRDEEETVTALEELMARGLITEQAAEHARRRDASSLLFYDFSHEKLRNMVYEETSLARRRLLHRRVAEALAAGRRADAGPSYAAAQIAFHYQQAGQDRLAAEQFVLAGDHARALYANAEALEHYQLALALGHPEPARIHESIGDLHTLGGDYDAAQGDFELAAAILERSGDADRVAAVEHKLGNIFQRRGEWDLATSRFAATLPKLSAASERARLVADWSLAAHHGGNSLKAQELAQDALTEARLAGDTQALAQTHNLLGILANSQGEFEEARAHLERSLELAEELGDPAARVAALNNLSLSYGTVGEMERALALAEQALALCTELGDRHRQAALYNNLADLLHAAERGDEAMDHLKQAVSIYAEIGGQDSEWRPEIWKLTEW